MPIPFSTFRGTLKQLDPNDTDEPARSNAFRWAFPAFLDPLVEHLDAPVPAFQKARPRRRRFSGGLFTRTQPLPRKRYYTVCIAPNGFDANALCLELKAYAGSIVRQKVEVYDGVVRRLSRAARSSMSVFTILMVKSRAVCFQTASAQPSRWDETRLALRSNIVRST
jgi:hypothetical protein